MLTGHSACALEHHALHEAQAGMSVTHKSTAHLCGRYIPSMCRALQGKPQQYHNIMEGSMKLALSSIMKHGIKERMWVEKASALPLARQLAPEQLQPRSQQWPTQTSA